MKIGALRSSGVIQELDMLRIRRRSRLRQALVLQRLAVFSLLLAATFGCSGSGPAKATHSGAAKSELPPASAAAPPSSPLAASSSVTDAARASPNLAQACQAFDWTPRVLPALLKPGTRASSAYGDQPESVLPVAFAPECTDSPTGSAQSNADQPAPVLFDGVELRVRTLGPAGSSGRGWAGNRCTFSVRLADGSGRATELGHAQVPPFTTVIALVRAGSAVWLNLVFNGYSSEFKAGGNRIIAVDLCAGRIVWQSPDSTSNGGLLLLGDYLIAPYGFTRERRYVHVLDARSGRFVQRLPVIENRCPSRSWAPNHRPGDRCDAPGQAVGAASRPRVEGGLFWVDTNTGSASFEFL